MDQVYANAYNNNHSEQVNFVDMGDENPYNTIAQLAQFSTEMCVGHVTSDGWEELDNYPNDFKVIMIHNLRSEQPQLI